VPADILDEMEISHAELDDELIEKYLDSGELTEEEFSHGLNEVIKKGLLIPVLCGSALQNVGVDLLFLAVVK
jgi:elongation factor G